MAKSFWKPNGWGGIIRSHCSSIPCF